MVMAVDSLHRLGYVHRDIKPDNVLLTADGHARLGDFGSCLQLEDDGLVHSSVAVGTPDYLSPEILRALQGGGGYGCDCDWWALGVCAYEMLLGNTPFYADSVSETYAKIIHFQDYFGFPAAGPEVSEEARSLIRGLICDSSGDFRKHPFFRGLDWSSLHLLPPPYHPDVCDATDTSNFDVLDDCLRDTGKVSEVTAGAAGVHLAFVGYSYTATRETGALDRSGDIMMEIDQHREEKHLQGKLNQEWRLRESITDEVQRQPDPERSDTLVQELQRRLERAERRNRELEQEMMGLREEILRLTADRSAEQCVCPAVLSVISAPDSSVSPPARRYPLVKPLLCHLLLFNRVWVSPVSSECDLLVCDGEMERWRDGGMEGSSGSVAAVLASPESRSG